MAMTAALTGLPGNPSTGLPPAIARIVGLPGLVAMPWTITPRGPRACAQRPFVVADNPVAARHAARAQDDRFHDVRVDVAHLPRDGRRLGPHHLIAGGQDRHARTPHDRGGRPAQPP